MGGHDVMRMSMIVREEALARDREFQRRNQIREAKAADAGRIGKVTWFGGLKATAHFLCGHIEGTTIARLANIYVRYGSKTARNAGARLARAMAADPHSVRDPLSILEHRCKEATT